MNPEATDKGPIAWMAKNSVAANLLMLLFLVGGIMSMSRIRQEVFPAFEVDMVNISVPYPGATPADIEQGILLVVEESVRGLDGVKRVTSSAVEGVGTVSVELLDGASGNKVLQDIKNEIDRVTSFPEEIEEPTVSLISIHRPVLSVILYGDVSEQVLRGLAEDVKIDIAHDPHITLATVSGTRPLEISVEVPLSKLREHGLTLGGIARQIRRTSIEMGGGGVKTPGGEMLVRVDERRDYGGEYADIPVITAPDGAKVRLEDIAEIRDGFADVDQKTLYNGKPAASVTVYRVGEEDPISVSKAANKFVRELRERLPETVKVDVVHDRSEIYSDRIGLLVRNAIIGLCLVMIILGMFLEVRLAFWVTLGIPISFIGCLLFLPYLNVSINMISLFAFIIAVGIVVDDAIVVGESIYYERQRGDGYLPGAVRGTRSVAIPVVFAILTNIIAFMPLLFVPGAMGQLWRNIPTVIIVVFSISLIEALFILPSHLAHQRVRSQGSFWKIVEAPQRFFGKKLNDFVEKKYNPFVKMTLRYRYTTVIIGFALFILVIGWWKGGRINYRFFPKVESDSVQASAALPYGAAFENTCQVEKRLRESAWRVLNEHGGTNIVEGVYSSVGSVLGGFGPAAKGGARGGHLVGVEVNLVSLDNRTLTAEKFTKLWRKEVGPIPGLESLSFKFSIGPSMGSPIDIELSHPDNKTLEEIAGKIADKLREYAGVVEIDDGVERGKEQFSFKLKPAARSLGITSMDLAAAVRNAFFGAEAYRQQRGHDEVKVYVRLPKSERRFEGDITRLIIRSSGGVEITLEEAAEITRTRAYQKIKRSGSRRTINVTADVVSKEYSPEKILADIKANVLPGIRADYPQLSYSLEGEQREKRESMGGMMRGFAVALIALFAVLAIVFKSYSQALIILIAIPFGIIGAIIGHIIMGFSMSFVSMMGLVALAGVVINDNILLIDTANEYRRGGMATVAAAANAPTRRFRPVLLTSLTTFLGLAPMIFETSVQARFMIPMAISLGFGILFSTLITLVLVPSLYLIVEDVKEALSLT